MTQDGSTRRVKFLHDIYQSDAVPGPHEVAIKYQGRALSWSELRGDVAVLASYLRRLGVSPEDRFAVLSKNNPLSINLALAAGAVGAMVVMVNWRLTPREIAFILQDSRSTIVFAETELAPLAGSGRQVINMDSPTFRAELSVLAPSELEAVAVDENAPVIVMYSSGTTGFPKGVMLSHRSMLWAPNNRPPQVNAVTGRPPAEIMVPMPLFHVSGMGAAIKTLARGARVALLRDAGVDVMLAAIEDGADVAFLAPTILQRILDNPSLHPVVGKLSELGYGASPMPLSLLRRVLATWPNVRFSQAYGATETGSVTELSDEAHRAAGNDRVLRSAGQPLSGVEIKIVDPDTLEEVRAGASGEIWVRAPHLSLGYLGNPSATAEAFLPDGWYRTGDLGAVDDDGFLYIRDRLKDMIISGGENIYCVEVESVLTTVEGVRSAAVVGVPDQRWGERPVAFIECEVGAEVTRETLAAHCREQLAPFKCPDRFLFTDDVPRTPSGKVRKDMLRARAVVDA
ncbi:AMP-binding protein [Mycobacterium syngnathidarum]